MEEDARAPARVSAWLWELEQRLLEFEAKLSFLARVTAPELLAEQRYFASGGADRALRLPQFRPTDTQELRVLHRRLGQGFGLARAWLQSSYEALILELLEERWQEFDEELELLSFQGTPRLLELVRARPFFPQSVEAQQLAQQFLQEGKAESELAQERLKVLPWAARWLRERHLSVRLLERSQLAKAAASAEALYLQPELRLSLDEAEQLLAHEVHGHWLPRTQAKLEGPPARVGTRRAYLDEEGRAVACEAEVLGTRWPQRRKAELALRYLCSVAVLDGAELLEVQEVFRRQGVEPMLLALTLLRVARGGGLCREGIYLAGWLRVRVAAPELKSKLARGRYSLEAAQKLLRFTGTGSGLRELEDHRSVVGGLLPGAGLTIDNTAD